MNTSKWLCAGLVAVFAWGALGGPAAMAQTQTPPGGAMPAPITTPPYEPTQGDRVGAGVLNVVYVPGKAIVCGAGVVAGGLLMLVPFLYMLTTTALLVSFVSW